MNNKILSVVLVLGIASTGFAGLASASHSKSGGQKSEMREVIKKIRSSEMSREEKRAFVEAKRVEIQAKRAEHRNVIDKLISGEGLTASEEAIRLEMLAKMQNDTLPRRDNGDIIEKLLAGDELSEEEIQEIESMLEKREMREARRAERREARQE